jgi:putative photosynthetic complex assembly protein
MIRKEAHTMQSFFSRWNAPRSLLFAVAALLSATVIMAVIARRTDVGATRLAEPVGGYAFDLRFEDAGSGDIVVTDIGGRLPPRRIAPGQDGFVRVALRSLAHDRRLAGAGPERPFQVGRGGDGRLWLRDPATGRLLYLDAYGHTNAQSFARLIDSNTGGIN